MNITRTRNLFFAAMLSVLSLGFSSCSDSEDTVATGTLTVDPSYTTKGIETDVESAIIEVPVNCNGRWFAEVDDNDWLSVLDEGEAIHNGNGTIKLKFDENRTGAGRKTSLYIVDFNQNGIEIPVYQTNLYRGEAPSNGAATWFTNNSVGCGANYSYLLEPKSRAGQKFDPNRVSMGNNIFNMANLETLNTNGSVRGQLYNMSRIEISNLDDKQLINSISKKQNLEVTLEMGCSFGFIEFQGSGKYVGNLTDNSDYVNYVICREAPVLNTNLQVANIASEINKEAQNFTEDEEAAMALDTLYQKLLSLESTKVFQRKAAYNKMKNKKKPTLGLFSEGFKSLYWELFYYYHYAKDILYPGDEVMQKAEMNKILDAIDNLYGPYFISGGQFGGSLNLYATVDKKDLDESVTFDASVTANISELFDLSGKVNFTSSGKQLYKKSKVVMQVYGGNAAETTASVTDFLAGDMTNTSILTGILQKWANSFAEFEDDGSTVVPKSAAPIVFYVTPIWTLFADVQLQGVVKDYFVKKYDDKGIADWNLIIEKSNPDIDVEDLLKKVSKDENTSNKKN